MSKDWVQDISDMHTKFGVNQKVTEFDRYKLHQFLEFRLRFLQEEMSELETAFKTKDAEEIVDSIIDLCVVAIGTLDAFQIDAYKAWDNVHNANMLKNVGVKESRPNPLGLPDLIKPPGWENPTHENNHGLLKLTFVEDAE